MADQITDTSGQAMIYVNVRVNEGLESSVVTARIPCHAGMFLALTANSHATVEAKRNGTADAFVDLAASPIDLTPYDGTTVAFDFKVQTNLVTSSLSVALPVRVTHNP
jgi:hypothetical protein